MMPLPDVLPIKPFTRPARGGAALPGSKSITNRALLLAALCDRPVTLANALFSEDTQIMAESLRRLGFVVEADEAEKTIYVEGRGGEIPSRRAELFVGNAGTAARFLSALCAAAPSGVYQIDGVPQMRRRPMKGLIDALRSQGAKITCGGQEGFFPITIEAHGLKGGEVEIDASESSQFLSGLLMVAPLALAPIKMQLMHEVRMPFVGMTKNLMRRFGAPAIEISTTGRLVVSNKEKYGLPAGVDLFRIENDATAASYFLALPIAVGGSVRITDYHLYQFRNYDLQGDAQFGEKLQKLGLIDGLKLGLTTHEVTGRRTFKRALAKPIDFNNFSDTFLTLAAIAPLLDRKVQIAGIGHTRKQESDRVAGMAQELKKLGQAVIEKKDSLTITPNLDELRKRAARGTIKIETYDDHRFAMSFAILGCHDLRGNGRPWLAIKNPACCAKTFPNFFEVLENLWKTSHSDK